MSGAAASGEQTGRIWSIQYLRAFAALAVVVYHYMETLPTKFHVGAAGVDIFFVISGFIMASLTFGREASPGVFLWRRLIRIVPLYWLATLAAAAALAIRPDFLYRGDGSLDNVVMSLLFIPHESHTGGVAPVLWQGWTLEYEMYFYLLCGLALFLPAQNRLKILCGGLIALSAIGYAFKLPTPWSTYSGHLLLEFVAGIALAAAWKTKRLPGVVSGAVLMLLGLAGFGLQQAGVLPGTNLRVIDWGVPAALIVAGALCLEAGTRVPRSKFALLLGDASYSLYLTHTLVISLVFWYGTSWNLPSWIFGPACVIGSIIVAIASYLIVEKPLTGFLKNVWKRPARAAAADPARS